MPFETGHKKYGGKRVGSVNKRTKEFETLLAHHDFCPASAQIDVYRKAEMQYESADQEQNTDLALKSLKIMSETSRDLCSYAYPKLKTIDYKKSSEWVNLTTLEQYKAVSVLQEELKKKLQETHVEPGAS